jgi:homogentisate 1,2-dioxygenase
MKNWISFPLSEGVASRQAHCDLPAGTFERELGKEGFFGPAAHMYHSHPPTGWSEFEGELRPRAFDYRKLNAMSHSPFDAPVLMSNAAMKFRQWRVDGAATDLARNADGDELLFVHEGEGALFCDWGHMRYRDGDYIVLPRGTMWRVVPAAPTTLLLIEATNDSYRLPDKGMVGRHAIFDAGCLDTPKLDAAFDAQKSESPTRVAIKRGGRVSTMTFPYNPLDAVGWHGDLTPVKINWREFRPLMSHRYHLPPSAHTTFVANRFVVCTFAPRPAESDPGALKVPFFHSNDDYDEIIFYHRGKFFSRDNIHPGMATLHPCGFAHGPHPKAFALAAKNPQGGQMLDEVAVMIDTRDAVDVAAMPDGVEWAGYVDSWKRKPDAAE